MLDLFDDSSLPGDGGQSELCSKEDLVPESACLEGSLVGVIGGCLDSQLFTAITPISGTVHLFSIPFLCSVDECAHCARCE